MTQTHSKATWYKDWFGEDYLKVYPHRNEAEAKQQVDFVINTLKLPVSYRLLDLGCGGGRHAHELSNRGYHVICLDLSLVLLNIAQKNSGIENCCPRFVRADMRHIPFRAVFDAVLSFFTTFGYFETDEENLQTWLNIQNVLKSGGQFFQDYINKSYVIDHLIPFDTKTGNGFTLTQERFYNQAEERIEKKILIETDGGVREYFESVRLYTLEEMRTFLAETELELEATFGGFDGSAFTEKSPRLLLTGRRK